MQYPAGPWTQHCQLSEEHHRNPHHPHGGYVCLWNLSLMVTENLPELRFCTNPHLPDVAPGTFNRCDAHDGYGDEQSLLRECMGS